MSNEIVTVNYGNVYIGNRSLGRAKRVLRRGKPHFIVVNEGGKVKGIRGYRRYVDKFGRDRGRTDVQVYARKDVTHRGLISVQLQPPMKFPAAHERFAVVALSWVEGFGALAVVGLHPTPSPRALAGTQPNALTAAYCLAMDRLTTLLHYLGKAGYKVVVAGDVQLSKGQAGSPEWDPYEHLRNNGFKVAVTAHLDLIGVGRGVRVLSAEVLARPGSATGSDHPFLTVSVARRGSRATLTRNTLMGDAA